jgi:predicted TIM-barrel fold metal-dependent hydrolase
VKLVTIDCHVHLRTEADIDAFRRLGAELNIRAMNVVCAPDPQRVNANPLAFLAKKRHPEFFYLFAGLDHSAQVSGGAILSMPLGEQVDGLADLGVDGFKLLETKPTSRRQMDLAIDSNYFAEAFERLEARDLPVLWHVADPEEFWDPELTPQWAQERGWGYDGSYVAKEQLYREVGEVLSRHPNLNVIFPHFYFLSADLDRAAVLFAEHPNVHFDLAPGIELLYNLSRTPDLAREFFVRHAERILFGTDTGMLAELPHDTCLARIDIVRRFLETADEFRLPPEADFLLGPPGDGLIRGIDLPAEALETICRTNFERLAGSSPRPLNAQLAKAECQRISAEVDALAGGKAEENPAARIARLL